MAGIFTRQADRDFARAVARLNATNPFLPERIACEREALGVEFRAVGAEWNKQPPQPTQHAHHALLTERAGRVLAAVRASWPAPRATKAWREEAELYEELAGFWLYQTYAPRFDAAVREQLAGGAASARLDFFGTFRADAERWLALDCGRRSGSRSSLAICGAIVAACMRGWGILRRSSPGLRARARNWWPTRWRARVSAPLIRAGRRWRRRGRRCFIRS
ncbi:MAG: hypothetical protein MUE42_14235, partial [Opitutaceae bacterium]|nr:hypothetical protein [Opitutaceae bacterium]